MFLENHTEIPYFSPIDVIQATSMTFKMTVFIRLFFHFFLKMWYKQ